jgi:hypothetical protein
MARELGIHRGWFHGGRHPHYDIPKRRIREIMARCRVVSSRDILKILMKARDRFPKGVKVRIKHDCQIKPKCNHVTGEVAAHL